MSPCLGIYYIDQGDLELVAILLPLFLEYWDSIYTLPCLGLYTDNENTEVQTLT